MRLFDKAMQGNDVPEKAAMDKSGANKAAIDEIIANSKTPIIVRQVKRVLAGIELMHIIRKGQFMMQGCAEMSFVN